MPGIVLCVGDSLLAETDSDFTLTKFIVVRLRQHNGEKGKHVELESWEMGIEDPHLPPSYNLGEPGVLLWSHSSTGHMEDSLYTEWLCG